MLSALQIGILLFGVGLSTMAQLCLKQAAMRSCGKRLTVIALQPWMWLGVSCTVLSTLTYTWVLRQVPLTVAMPFAALVYALVPLGARHFFAEVILPRFWCGVLLIGCGVILTAL